MLSLSSFYRGHIRTHTCVFVHSPGGWSVEAGSVLCSALSLVKGTMRTRAYTHTHTHTQTFSTHCGDILPFQWLHVMWSLGGVLISVRIQGQCVNLSSQMRTIWILFLPFPPADKNRNDCVRVMDHGCIRSASSVGNTRFCGVFLSTSAENGLIRFSIDISHT